MNAISPVAGASMVLLPQNLAEAMKLAELMSKAKLLPAAVQNPADAFMIVNQALRWGMDPFAVAQEVAVIQGRMMYSGKIVAAAIHTSGVLDGRLSYSYDGANGDLAVTVAGRLRGEADVRTVTVRLKDAKTANQHWAKSPEQMLSYHAARVWARRHAPEVMLGVYVPEEFEPEERREPKQVAATVVKPEPKQQTARAEQPASQSRAEMDRTLDDDQIPDWGEPASKPDHLRKVADRIKLRLSEAQDPDAYNAIMQNTAMQAEWERIKRDRPELAQQLEAYRSEQLDRITAAYAEQPA